MPIDSSIAMGIRPVQIDNPMNALAQMMQIKDAQQNSQFNTMKIQQQQVANDRQNKLYTLMGGLGADTTDDQRSSALKGAGFFDQADLIDKNSIARQTAKSEGQAKQAKALTDYMTVQKDLATAVIAQPTQQNAMMALDRAAQYHKMLGFGEMETAAERQAIAGMTSPDQIKQWAAGHSLKADQLLPKNVDFAAGDRHINQSINTVTGVPTQTGSTVIGQSADNRATVANAANTARMANQRALDANNLTKEANANVYDPERGMLINKATGLARPASTMSGNPLGAKDKPLTDAQSKAALFGSRMQEANSILSNLAESGTTTSIPGIDSGWGIGSTMNVLATGNQQKLMQAKRDFVNSVLRRESGAVIAQPEFDNAEKQYFPQIGDSDTVKAQKASNRAIAIRGVQAEIPRQQRADVVNEITGKNNKGWTLHTDASGNKAYVSPDGKQFEEVQ